MTGIQAPDTVHQRWSHVHSAHIALYKQAYRGRGCGQQRVHTSPCTLVATVVLRPCGLLLPSGVECYRPVLRSPMGLMRNAHVGFQQWNKLMLDTWQPISGSWENPTCAHALYTICLNSGLCHWSHWRSLQNTDAIILHRRFRPRLYSYSPHV